MGFPYTFPFVFDSTTFDYEYELGAGNHNFFEKTNRKRLVIPNRIIVKSYPTHTDQYSGSAVDDDSYDLLGRYIDSKPYYIRATSNDQCDDIAIAILQDLQVASERGSGVVPMNCGQEVMDFIKITDSVSSDWRVGNVSYLKRQYVAGKKFQTEIKFGGLGGGTPLWSEVDESQPYVTWDALNETWDYIDQKDYDIVDRILSGIDGQNILEGTITLSDKVYGDLDDIDDGTTYAKVLSTNISAGLIVLSECSGDIDDIDDGTTYAKVLSTNISAGLIVLSECSGDIDDIDDGTTYAKVLATEISSGYIKLTSNTVVDGEWYDESGVVIDATSGINIYGTNNALTTRATKTGTIQCYVNSSGEIVAGAGNVVMNSTGIYIKSSSVFNLYDGATARGWLAGGTYGVYVSSTIDLDCYLVIGNVNLPQHATSPTAYRKGAIYYNTTDDTIYVCTDIVGPTWEKVAFV